MPKLPSNQSAASRYDNPSNATDEAELERDATETTEGTRVEFVKALISMHTNTSTVVDVPEWELDILREIHGPESVKVLSSREVIYPHTAAEAMQYLKNKYKTREQEDHIKTIYPRLRDFAKSTGLPFQAGDDAKSNVQSSSVIVRDVSNRLAAPASSVEQGAAGSGIGGRAGG